MKFQLPIHALRLAPGAYVTRIGEGDQRIVRALIGIAAPNNDHSKIPGTDQGGPTRVKAKGPDSVTKSWPPTFVLRIRPDFLESAA